MSDYVAIARNNVRESIAEMRKALAECPPVKLHNGDFFEYPPVEEARWALFNDFDTYRREQRMARFVGPSFPFPF